MDAVSVVCVLATTRTSSQVWVCSVSSKYTILCSGNTLLCQFMEWNKLRRSGNFSTFSSDPFRLPMQHTFVNIVCYTSQQWSVRRIICDQVWGQHNDCSIWLLCGITWQIGMKSRNAPSKIKPISSLISAISLPKVSMDTSGQGLGFKTVLVNLRLNC